MARPRETSAEQRKREGTFRADRHADGPPIAPAGAARLPSGLTRPERDAWQELAADLEDLGLLSPVDSSMLEAAACALARARIWAREARRLPAKSRFVSGNAGVPKAHPVFEEERKAWREFRNIAGAMGLSHKGRSTLRLPGGGSAGDGEGDETPTDPLAKLNADIRNMPLRAVE
jgi:P27 family predicted phage terminase small subunit